jgi:hypothetical protein
VAPISEHLEPVSEPSSHFNPKHPLPPPPAAAAAKKSGGGAAIAALGGKERRIGIEQLKIIENHFIGFAPNQIHPDVIKVRRLLRFCTLHTMQCAPVQHY